VFCSTNRNKTQNNTQSPLFYAKLPGKEWRENLFLSSLDYRVMFFRKDTNKSCSFLLEHTHNETYVGTELEFCVLGDLVHRKRHKFPSNIFHNWKVVKDEQSTAGANPSSHPVFELDYLYFQFMRGVCNCEDENPDPDKPESTGEDDFENQEELMFAMEVLPWK